MKTKECLMFHKWKVDRDTGITVYKRCLKCGKRVIEQRISGGYQPIDKKYIDELKE
jgi:hypothetical protein